MSDEEDQLRGMLAERAGRVHSHLSGPAIRARSRSRGVVRRYAPLVSAAAVLSILVLGLVLFQRGGSPAAPVPPATTVTTTISPSPTATMTPAPTPSTAVETVSPNATTPHR